MASLAEPPPATGLPAGYEFVRYLGHGGSGVVVCARHVALDRLVAVKTIYGGARGTDAHARLEREARLLARLDHPHVVRVHALVPIGDDAALVMEYVDGAPWSLGTSDPTVGRTLEVLDQVAEALAYLAAHRIVHRDVKPSNVLIGRAGCVKLADFGISRLIGDAALFRTAGDVAVGTPGYAPPEQLFDPARERVETDHYSFAVMAARALSGVVPDHLDAEGLAAAGLPEPAARVIAAGTSIDPRERPSPRELVATLRTIDPATWPTRHVAPVTAPDATEATEEAEATRVRPASGSTPGPPGVRPAQVVGTTGHVPVVAPPVFHPHRRRRRPPAVLFGLVAAILVLVVLLLVVRP